MPVLVAAIASLLAAEPPRPPRIESMEPLPSACRKSTKNPVCVRWALLHGDFLSRLMLLRGLEGRPPAESQPYVAELEKLATHWVPEFRTMSQELLSRAGHSNPKWEKPVCPKQRDLSAWTPVPSRATPQFPQACGRVTPGEKHSAVFTPDERTCIYSTNRGEWGSSLTVRIGGKTAWKFDHPLFHPADVMRARDGFWIIESLNHKGGSGAVSLLSKDAAGKWRLQRVEEFPSVVEAWRLDGSTLVVAVGRSDLPENPCQQTDGAVWVLSFADGDRPSPVLQE